jgi:hypothetical protein
MMINGTDGGLAKTVYFLGAGATKADFPESPMGDELLHRVLADADRDEEVVHFLSGFYDATLLRKETPKERRPHLDDVLTAIEAPLSGRAPWPPAHSREALLTLRWRIYTAIARQVANGAGFGHGSSALALAKHAVQTGSAVISTNYDIVMDNALFHHGNVNYGVVARGCLGDTIQPNEWSARDHELRWFRLVEEDLRAKRGKVPLLKLHGSLNWLYCPKCDELDLFLEQKGALQVFENPDAGRCCSKACTGRYEPIVVGPSAEQKYTNRVLAETWNRAERELAEAEQLVVIGYSMPPADYMIRNLLARHFSRRSARVTVVTKADRQAGAGELKAHYRRLFPECGLIVDGFEGIIAAAGA